MLWGLRGDCMDGTCPPYWHIVSNQWILLLIPFIIRPVHWWIQLGNSSLASRLFLIFHFVQRRERQLQSCIHFFFPRDDLTEGENSGPAETRSTLDLLRAVAGHVNQSPLCLENTSPGLGFYTSPLTIHSRSISLEDLWGACGFSGWALHSDAWPAESLVK